MQKVTLSAKSAAQYLGISYWKLLDMVKKHEIPFISVGRLKLFRKDTLNLWLDNKERISAASKNNSVNNLRKIPCN